MLLQLCVVASLDPHAWSVSCLVFQHQFDLEENSRCLVCCPWAVEGAWQNSWWNCSCVPGCSVLLLHITARGGFSNSAQRGATGVRPDTSMLTKWFHSTRLETRTKESNICASSRVVKPACVMKVTAGIFAPAIDQSIERGLSASISVRTRKMVNYA